MAILVTGGAGFIGSNFIQHWLEKSDEPVVNLDKLTYSGSTENLSFAEKNHQHKLIVGDINDQTLLQELLNTHNIRAIIHFAAESHVDNSIVSPDAFIQTNINGTFSLLEATRKFLSSQSDSFKNDFRFLHISTDEVYGTLEPSDPPFTENTPYAPSSPYSASKAASDHLVHAYFHTYGIPTITSNCSNNYGPRQHHEKLIPLIITNALAREPLPVYGDGQQVRDWLYVDDHCHALIKMLSHGTPGQSYNVGGHNEKANMDVVTLICNKLDIFAPRADGTSYKQQIQHVTDRPGHDRRYAINPEKIHGKLKWEPIESFESGLDKTIKWYVDRLHINQVNETTSGHI